LQRFAKISSKSFTANFKNVKQNNEKPMQNNSPQKTFHAEDNAKDVL